MKDADLDGFGGLDGPGQAHGSDGRGQREGLEQTATFHWCCSPFTSGRGGSFQEASCLSSGIPSGGRRGAHCGLDLFVEAPEQRLCLFLALAGIGRRKGAASRRGSMPSRPGYAGEGGVFNGFSPDIDGEGAVGSGWGGVALTSLLPPAARPWERRRFARHHRGASGRGIQGVRLRLVRSAWEQRTLQAGDDDLRRQCADEQAHQATDDL